MADALIGATGFVGTTLLRQTSFDDVYRSTTIESIRGCSYDVVVCAGAPAEKWKANKEPERDRENIQRMLACLGEVEAKHVILISTVDVYATPIDVDEDSPIDPAAATPYGRHRFEIEQFVQDRFASTIIRLPGLFGRGLKKNIIFDFLHANAVGAICADSLFQFYHLDRLWQDITIARAHALPTVNFAVEPVSVRDVAKVGFGVAFENPAVTNAARYDMHTKYAERFDSTGAYLATRAQVLSSIRQFVEEWRREHP
ncbi:MAG: pyridine nucleotide transhydrogenase [Gemmatimonadaceae bacterium]|nr:pyridine nucleotide transhydrogenase [Gemmatimonadaceae bacterium]